MHDDHCYVINQSIERLVCSLVPEYHVWL